ncbi:hypothetical protein FB451DRAFT_1409915 [Mycena latifolia]|nr:hypothetical protein FB451DRAFT_1409915 [Mycena latifolia]
MNVDDPEGPSVTSYLRPGTVGILQTLIHNPSVKRVVSEPKTFGELDWDEEAPSGVTALGAGSSAVAKHAAERAAWEFMERRNSEIGWDLVVLNPPGVFVVRTSVVPPHAYPQCAHSRRAQNDAAAIYTRLTEPPSGAERTASGRLVAWVDVRDLARAHVLVPVKAADGGERIIVSAGSFVWQDCLHTAPSSSKFQKDVPDGAKGAVRQI